MDASIQKPTAIGQQPAKEHKSLKTQAADALYNLGDGACKLGSKLLSIFNKPSRHVQEGSLNRSGSEPVNKLLATRSLTENRLPYCGGSKLA